MMSLKLILSLPWSPSCRLSASRASAARSMSTSLVRKKWGTGPSDVASRLAIVFRICVSGISSKGAPPGAVTGERGSGSGRSGSAATASAAGTDFTSRFTTRPPGPVPRISFKSTPASLAIRLARGDALTRVASATATVPVATADGSWLTAAGWATAAGVAATATAPRSPLPVGFTGAATGVASTVSPGAPMYATTSPTGTVSPSLTACCSSWPSARATSSITALSVSTSASVSPLFTASPTALVHLTRRPSSIVGESASITTLVAMSVEVEDPAGGRDDLVGRRLGQALELLVVGHRRVRLRDPQHRGIQLVERVALDDVHHLRADAAVGPPFLGEDGGLVQRPQRAEIHHLGGDALAGELLGRLQRRSDGLGVADHGDVAPGPLHLGLPDRHQQLALGHLALGVVKHLALQHHHGVVVTDRGLEQAL